VRRRHGGHFHTMHCSRTFRWKEQRVMRWSSLRNVWDTGQRADRVLVGRTEGKRPLGRGKYQLRPTVKKLCQLRHQMYAACHQLCQLTWVVGGGEFHQSEGPSAVVCTHTELVNDMDSAQCCHVMVLSNV